jgi:2-phospho-L-lactate guanylyltransferase (CobY/MobA/RfbA family)
VSIVPDRHLDGTNVICVPTGAGFRFSYGPASFTNHRDEARRLGLTARIITDEALSWDVDQPADLDYPAHLLETT